jgi:hypothetical protein
MVLGSFLKVKEWSTLSKEKKCEWQFFATNVPLVWSLDCHFSTYLTIISSLPRQRVLIHWYPLPLVWYASYGAKPKHGKKHMPIPLIKILLFVIGHYATMCNRMLFIIRIVVLATIKLVLYNFWVAWLCMLLTCN